jgi:hypothetical protein
VPSDAAAGEYVLSVTHDLGSVAGIVAGEKQISVAK